LSIDTNFCIQTKSLRNYEVVITTYGTYLQALTYLCFNSIFPGTLASEWPKLKLKGKKVFMQDHDEDDREFEREMTEEEMHREQINAQKGNLFRVLTQVICSIRNLLIFNLILI
jgi:hypothetical protein